jgi:hypothetical protein
MSIVVTVNHEVNEHDSLLIALRELADQNGYRWGLPSAKALERTEVPRGMTMPALYDQDGALVTTHPVVALRVLVEAAALGRLEGIDVSIANGDLPEATPDAGTLKGQRVQWHTVGRAELMELADMLRWREANVQIADYRAAQARRERDLDLDSFIGDGSMTAYRAAKTLKMSPTAVGMIRKRVKGSNAKNNGHGRENASEG